MNQSINEIGRATDTLLCAAAQTDSSEGVRADQLPEDSGEGDGENDILAVIRRCKDKASRHSGSAVGPSMPRGATTAIPDGLLTRLNAKGLPADPARPTEERVHGGGSPPARSASVRSEFLAKYDYSGRRRRHGATERRTTGNGVSKPTTATQIEGRQSTPKHTARATSTSTPRKRQAGEVIDLTASPAEPAPTVVTATQREGKRRRLETKHRRSKPPPRSERSAASRSRAHDDARRKEEAGAEGEKQTSSQTSQVGQLSRSWDLRNAGSPESHTNNKNENKHKHKHEEASFHGRRDERGHKERHRRRAGEGGIPAPARQGPGAGVQQHSGLTRQNSNHSGEHGRLKSSSSNSSRTPGTNDREIINAVKYRAVTAGDKARDRIEEIKAKQHAAAAGSRSLLTVAGDIENDADLFRQLSSKQQEKRTTQLVPNLRLDESRPPGAGTPAGPNSRDVPAPASLAPRPASTPAQAQAQTPAARPAVKPKPASSSSSSSSTSSLPFPQARNIFQPKPRRQTRANLPSKNTAVFPPPDPDPPPAHPTPLSRPDPAASKPARPIPARSSPSPPTSLGPPRPVRPVRAIEALDGADRTVLQWVVYRTPRFKPPPPPPSPSPSSSSATKMPGGSETAQPRQARAVRCSTHLSLREANAQAAARLERVRGGGVAGKAWGLVPAPSSSSRSSSTSSSSSSSSSSSTTTTTMTTTMMMMYEGKVVFESGEEQHFWVGEETTDLGGPVRAARAARGGSSGDDVWVDAAAAAVYRRRRFDVWSRVFWGRGCEGRRREKRVVFECGGDEDEDEERKREREGEGAAQERGGGDGVDLPAGEGSDGDGGDNIQGDNSSSSHGESSKDAPEEDTRSAKDDGDAEDDRARAVRESSASSTWTAAFPAHRTPLDLVRVATRLHGTYTTLGRANRAALATFLELARPRNGRIEDHHHYAHEVRPGMTAAFDESGAGDDGCAAPAEIEWDPPAAGGRYRWGFLRLVVEVVESELTGPVDIGDMLVDGPEGGRGDGAAAGAGRLGGNGENGEFAARERAVAAGEPRAARAGPVEEESEGGEVSEEE